jgi:predicted O-methyltransferase YrrM
MLPQQLLDYVADLFWQEDQVLKSARLLHDKEDLPAIQISAEEGSVIAVLLRAVQARRVLEIGTLGGYSGIWIARALPEGGTLTTIERDARHASVARRAFTEAGVSDKVELIEGDAREVLPRLRAPFDAVFVDADKESQGSYYHEAMRLLRVGGLLLCDNAFIHERVLDSDDTRADVEGVRACNRAASQDPRLTATILPIRDGLLVGVKQSR